MRLGRVQAWCAGLVLASGPLGCATQSSTAQALAIVGTAAVIVGAAMADGDDCYQDPQGTSGPDVYCSPGLSKGARKAGTAIAAAGVGAAAAGYALQPKGPDRRSTATAPRAPTQPYRLIRQTPPEPAPPEVAPASATAPSASPAAPSAAPASASAPSSVPTGPVPTGPVPTGPVPASPAVPPSPAPAAPEH